MVLKQHSPIPISDIVFSGNEQRYVNEAVASTWVSSTGYYINKFEESFAKRMGASHAVSVNNGTSALLLALKALNIGPGDEVIAPTFTFAATVNAIIYSGATPVLVDSMPNHWNIDATRVEEAITPATRAIIPVHLYGHPCDMKEILRIAEIYKLYVIEDAAEAHSADCMDKKVGTLGTIGCFSFYANKIITTGEGGMCITQDVGINERLRVLRDHGMNKNKRYWHDDIGFNFRMTNLNAALGVAQLEQLDTFLERRKFLSAIYDERLVGLPHIAEPKESLFGSPVHWLYCIFLKDSSPIDRDEFLVKLEEYKIDARPTFYPVHTMPPYREIKRSKNMLNAEKYSSTGINLPVHPSLADKDVYYIIEAITKIFS